MIQRGLLTAGMVLSAAWCGVTLPGPASAQTASAGYGPSMAAPDLDSPPAAQSDAPVGPATVPGTTHPNAVIASGATTSLSDALAEVYLTNPTLRGERAHLRATDEGVPTALAGWRPTVSYTLQPGWGFGTLGEQGSRTATDAAGQAILNAQGKEEKLPLDETIANSRWVFQQQVSISQPLYRGGRTVAATAQAENNVRSERANLLSQEETTLSDAVNAYVTVIEDQQLYQLDVSNVQDLTAQLQATEARFQVGEIDRTDVAQAQAALAGGIAERETAYGTLQTARATYREVIGELPNNLVDPEPLALPVSSSEEADTLASVNNASVLAAMYQDSSAKDAVDAAYANLMPQVDAQVTGFYDNQGSVRGTIQRGGEVGGELTMPIYQGGSEYAAIRQAKQTEQQSRMSVDDARRTAVEQATGYWESYVAAKATVAATRVQIHADEIALDGVEREALAGTETTLDVLLDEQQLLAARTTLVQNLATLVNDSYSLAASIGRLSARDLGLKVPYYDDKAYYNAVRNLPWGTADHATDQPGR